MLMLARKFANYMYYMTTYGRDNTKQAEMPYFHWGPSD